MQTKVQTQSINLFYSFIINRCVRSKDSVDQQYYYLSVKEEKGHMTIGVSIANLTNAQLNSLGCRETIDSSMQNHCWAKRYRTLNETQPRGTG